MRNKGKIAPGLVAYDVHQGRSRLNFSSWGGYTAAQRLKMLKEINEEIADGDMPPFYYVYPMHMDARLSAADKRAFKQWITSESANLTQQMSDSNAVIAVFGLFDPCWCSIWLRERSQEMTSALEAVNSFACPRGTRIGPFNQRLRRTAVHHR